MTERGELGKRQGGTMIPGDGELVMRIVSLIAGVVLAAAMASLANAADAPVVIKFSHVVTPDAPKGKGAQKFKELAEAALPGKVVIEIYPNSQLYKDKEEMEALQLGSVQMLAPSLAKFGPLGAKEFEVFDLPYIFPGKAALTAVTQGPIGRDLLGRLASKGITGLAFWDNGFKILSANRPLKSPDDLLGLKMRIQSSKILEAEMKALGASPQVMAFSEVYQGLQTGVVDGTENPPSNMFTQRIHEVQRHGTLTNHGYLGYAVIVNKPFWDGLPGDVRDGLEKAMAEATVYVNELAQKDNDAALAAMKASGKTLFITPSPEEQKAWMAALEPVQKEMAGRVGHGLIAAIKAATVSGQVTAKPAPSLGTVAPKDPTATVPAVIAYAPALAAPLTALVLALVLIAAFFPSIPILDRLEEIIVATLIAAATALIFVAVLQRYSLSASANLARFASDQSLDWLRQAALATFKTLRSVNLTWAQELCIYMFVWMAKFGAALGVRQGIHVGVDVLTNQLGSKSRRIVIPFALVSGAVFTGIVGALGALFVTHIAHTDQTSADLELPMWLVYLAIPLGSFLMCLRFLQVLFTYLRGGELPGHGHAQVEVPGTNTGEVAA